eukprot:82900-Amorphochlora_amoeboformis.AAC.1
MLCLCIHYTRKTIRYTKSTPLSFSCALCRKHFCSEICKRNANNSEAHLDRVCEALTANPGYWLASDDRNLALELLARSRRCLCHLSLSFSFVCSLPWTFRFLIISHFSLARSLSVSLLVSLFSFSSLPRSLDFLSSLFYQKKTLLCIYDILRLTEWHENGRGGPLGIDEILDNVKLDMAHESADGGEFESGEDRGGTGEKEDEKNLVERMYKYFGT